MQPQRWEQFVNKDHHTDARVSLGNERGEGLAPIKDHLPHPCELQRMDKEGGGQDNGRAWNVGFSSKVLPLCWESNPETPMIMTLILWLFYYSRLARYSSPQRHMDEDEKCQANILKEASSVTKFFLNRCCAGLFACLSLQQATAARIQSAPCGN